jgi:hypothetical protein
MIIIIILCHIICGNTVWFKKLNWLTVLWIANGLLVAFLKIFNHSFLVFVSPFTCSSLLLELETVHLHFYSSHIMLGSIHKRNFLEWERSKLKKFHKYHCSHLVLFSFNPSSVFRDGKLHFFLGKYCGCKVTEIRVSYELSKVVLGGIYFTITWFHACLLLG